LTPKDGPAVTFDTVPDVRSVADLFALGTALEREAAHRYDQLASRMEAEGEADLAGLFRKLRDAEAEHESGLTAWAGRAGVAAADLTFRWDSPETMAETEVAEAGPGRGPWAVLALAVRNEERAFAFYAQVAAKASHPDVQRHAERLAAEELRHVALLRLERRRAWRSEQAAMTAELPSAGPPRATDANDLAAYVRQAELEAAGRLSGKARRARAVGEATVAGLFADLAEEAEGRARAAGATAPLPEVPAAPAPVAVLMREEEDRLSRLYDGYMRLIETLPEEAVLRGAQEETLVLLSRLARLHDERIRLGTAGA
jgi:rubrerythrin